MILKIISSLITQKRLYRLTAYTGSEIPTKWKGDRHFALY